MLSNGKVSAQESAPQHVLPPGWIAPHGWPRFAQPPGGGPATWQVLLMQLRPVQQMLPAPQLWPLFRQTGGAAEQHEAGLFTGEPQSPSTYATGTGGPGLGYAAGQPAQLTMQFGPFIDPQTGVHELWQVPPTQNSPPQQGLFAPPQASPLFRQPRSGQSAARMLLQQFVETMRRFGVVPRGSMHWQGSLAVM